jgi:hypothetical protein
VECQSIKLPPAKFKFTSGGKQFYVDYNIPRNADVWSVEKATLSIEEVRQALQDLLRRQQQTSGHESAT